MARTKAANANFAWLQHFLHHLSPNGRAGVVLAKGSLTSKSSGEGDIHRALVADAKLIDCIVNLPAKLFLNTQIPACLWFMNRSRESSHPRNHAWRTGEPGYVDDTGFCASVPLARVAELEHVLTPGRYVGLPDEDEDFNFAERFAALKAEFAAQLLEEARLNAAIAENLAKVRL